MYVHARFPSTIARPPHLVFHEISIGKVNNMLSEIKPPTQIFECRATWNALPQQRTRLTEFYTWYNDFHSGVIGKSF